MIRGGLAGRVGGSRVIGGFFGKEPVITQAAEYFVGGDMVKHKVFIAARFKIAAGGVQHIKRANDIGLDKLARRVY